MGRKTCRVDYDMGGMDQSIHFDTNQFFLKFRSGSCYRCCVVIAALSVLEKDLISVGYMIKRPEMNH